MRSTNKLFFYSPLLLQNAIWPITRPLLRFFIRYEIQGLENLKNLPKGIIFAANHSSELDTILVPAALPFFSRFMPIFYVSKPKEFYVNSGWRQFLYGGFIFKLWGAHSTISGYKDYGISLSPHIHIIQHGHSVLIFPEGKKTKTGEVVVDEARGGVAFLAEKTEFPIVPVFISGVFNMRIIDFLFRRRKVSITFGKPIYAYELLGHSPTGENKYKLAAKQILREVKSLRDYYKRCFYKGSDLGNINTYEKFFRGSVTFTD